MTMSRSESSAISSMTMSWLGSGSRRTVCSVVTNGIFKPRSRRKMWLPAGPPKIPYSCCKHTMSMLLKFRNSAAS